MNHPMPYRSCRLLWGWKKVLRRKSSIRSTWMWTTMTYWYVRNKDHTDDSSLICPKRSKTKPSLSLNSICPLLDRSKRVKRKISSIVPWKGYVFQGTNWQGCQMLMLKMVLLWRFSQRKRGCYSWQDWRPEESGESEKL